MHSTTSHLPDAIKRALLMVDGNATFGEISKRAAPSLRATLDEMFQELEKGGFIKDKGHEKAPVKAHVKVPDQSKNDNIPKMSVPLKMATPHKSQPVADEAGELDFMSGFAASTHPTETAVAAAEVAAAEAAAEAAAAEAAAARAEAENKSKQEIEAAKLHAQQEAEAILHKAEQEAARIREETVRRAKADAEATRIKAEQEAKRVHDGLVAAKLKAEQETKLRLEAASKLRQQAEAARIKAEQEAEQMRIELETAKIRAELEAKARIEAAAMAQARMEEEARARIEAERIVKLEQETARVREEAERIVKREQEEAAKALAARTAEAASVTGEKEAAQMRIEQEVAKIRAEMEAKAHLEATAKAQARAQAESDSAAKAREEAERILKLEQDVAKAREADDSREQMARSAEAAPEEKPSAFSFDSFQVDKPLYTSESHIDKPSSAPKGKQPAKNVRPVEAAPAAKSGTFSFDSFQVDKPLYTSESHAEKQPAHKDKVSAAAAVPANKAVEPTKSIPPTQKASPAHQPATAATRPAEAHQPAKPQAVSPPVASKPIDGNPNQEQIQRAMQERKAVEARMAAEALEAKKLAEAQAKVWAEAEQRAHEAARAEVNQVTKQATFTVDETPVAKPAQVERVSRKSFPWGRIVGFMFKLGLFLLVLLVGALFVIPYVMPMREYMPKAEQLLSAKLHQPVHIGRLSGRILPMPRLELGEIYIGDAKQFQADDAQINFALSGLFTEAKPVSSIEFQGVKIRGAWLMNASEWLQKMANEEKYPVSRMVISQGTLDADIFTMTGVEGELNFDQAGKFTQANLRANAGKYSMGINATPENKLQVAIAVKGAALPLLPNWTFDDLTAKGELNNTELVISDFDGRILGGTLQGNASINWRSGWRAQGAITGKTISMKQFSHLLEGNVEGSARFKMTSLDLAGLTDSVTLEGSFSAGEGMLSGMDIIETARTRSKEHLPGGRNPFDKLSGVIAYADNTYHFKQTKITTSVMNATATFDVTKQQLSGKMNVNSSAEDGAVVDLQIGGTTESPTLRYTR